MTEQATHAAKCFLLYTSFSALPDDIMMGSYGICMYSTEENSNTGPEMWSCHHAACMSNHGTTCNAHPKSGCACLDLNKNNVVWCAVCAGVLRGFF